MRRKIFLAMMCAVVVLGFVALSIAEEKETARQEKIQKAQQDLAALGYYKGEASGKIDKDTREAVKEFQKKEMGMKIPNGILNEKTCDEIAKKAEKKMKEGKEEGKGPMEKMEEGKEKLQEGVDKIKPPM